MFFYFYLLIFFLKIPRSLVFSTTNSSGTFLGQLQIDGVYGETNDWIAAFDESRSCCGASSLIIFNNIAYINLTIYGDDATTLGVDEGMDNGESFTLKLYDSSEDEYLIYQSPISITTFDGWSNTNGAPMTNYNDANEIYNFISLVEVNLSLIDTVICTNQNSFNFSGGTPEGGEYFINGINTSESYPSDWNSVFMKSAIYMKMILHYKIYTFFLNLN